MVFDFDSAINGSVKSVTDLFSENLMKQRTGY
ncbi:MAG: hypothetical protein K0S32_1982 [Bacteroidetes bacterium]|jgi:hypothetical protein|nr:hypothetical protein [Bacteroidota bacterium]